MYDDAQHFNKAKDEDRDNDESNRSGNIIFRAPSQMGASLLLVNDEEDEQDIWHPEQQLEYEPEQEQEQENEKEQHDEIHNSETVK